MADRTHSGSTSRPDHHEVELIGRRRLSEQCVELQFSRPQRFEFAAGQTLCILSEGIARHYSMVSSPVDPVITLCVRHVPQGILSPILAAAAIGTRFAITGPHGYFSLKPSSRPVVFVATGNGIAPFASMVRSGARPLVLLHGVRQTADLYYRSLVSPAAATYIPCLSQAPPDDRSDPMVFYGRVTDCLERRLPTGSYDFYLCGNQSMIRDVTLLVDDRFAGSCVFNEVFF